MFQPAEDGCGGIGAHVGASALAVVRQPFAPFRVLVPNGRIQRRELSRSVLDEGGQHLSHQFLIFQRNVPELLAIQDQSGVCGMHTSIFGRKLPPQNRPKALRPVLDLH